MVITPHCVCPPPFPPRRLRQFPPLSFPHRGRGSRVFTPASPSISAGRCRWGMGCRIRKRMPRRYYPRGPAGVGMVGVEVHHQPFFRPPPRIRRSLAQERSGHRHCWRLRRRTAVLRRRRWRLTFHLHRHVLRPHHHPPPGPFSPLRPRSSPLSAHRRSSRPTR